MRQNQRACGTAPRRGKAVTRKRFCGCAHVFEVHSPLRMPVEKPHKRSVSEFRLPPSRVGLLSGKTDGKARTGTPCSRAGWGDSSHSAGMTLDANSNVGASHKPLGLFVWLSPSGSQTLKGGSDIRPLHNVFRKNLTVGAGHAGPRLQNHRTPTVLRDFFNNPASETQRRLPRRGDGFPLFLRRGLEGFFLSGRRRSVRLARRDSAASPTNSLVPPAISWNVTRREARSTPSTRTVTGSPRRNRRPVRRPYTACSSGMKA